VDSRVHPTSGIDCLEKVNAKKKKKKKRRRRRRRRRNKLSRGAEMYTPNACN
jgi:hypothetical protein